MTNETVVCPLLSALLSAYCLLEKDALLAFYRRLIDDVMPLRMENIDLDGYYSHGDLE